MACHNSLFLAFLISSTSGCLIPLSAIHAFRLVIQSIRFLPLPLFPSIFPVSARFSRPSFLITTSSAILLVPYTKFFTIIFYYHISCYFMLCICTCICKFEFEFGNKFIHSLFIDHVDELFKLELGGPACWSLQLPHPPSLLWRHHKWSWAQSACKWAY